MPKYDLINYTRYKREKVYAVIDKSDNYNQLVECARYMYASSGMNYAVVEHETQEVLYESGEW